MAKQPATRTGQALKESHQLANLIDLAIEQAGTSRLELARQASAKGVAGRNTVLAFLRGANDLTLSKALALAEIAGVTITCNTGASR